MTAYQKLDFDVGSMVTTDDANIFLYSNFNSIYDPPLHEFISTTESDWSTSSTTPVLIGSNFATTLTTQGGDLLVTLRGSFKSDVAGASVALGLRLNGVLIYDYFIDWYLESAGSDLYTLLQMVAVFQDLRAGSHTFEWVWMDSIGHTLTLHGGGGAQAQHPQFFVWEF